MPKITIKTKITPFIVYFLVMLLLLGIGSWGILAGQAALAYASFFLLAMPPTIGLLICHKRKSKIVEEIEIEADNLEKNLHGLEPQQIKKPSEAIKPLSDSVAKIGLFLSPSKDKVTELQKFKEIIRKACSQSKYKPDIAVCFSFHSVPEKERQECFSYLTQEFGSIYFSVESDCLLAYPFSSDMRFSLCRELSFHLNHIKEDLAGNCHVTASALPIYRNDIDEAIGLLMTLATQTPFLNCDALFKIEDDPFQDDYIEMGFDAFGEASFVFGTSFFALREHQFGGNIGFALLCENNLIPQIYLTSLPDDGHGSLSFIADVKHADKNTQILLQRIGAKSMLYRFVYGAGQRIGLIYFVSSTPLHLSQKQIDEINYHSLRRGTVLLEAYYQNKEQSTRSLLMSAGRMENPVISVDAETYQIQNAELLDEKAQRETYGKKCYQVLKGRTKPCKDCPMSSLNGEQVISIKDCFILHSKQNSFSQAYEQIINQGIRGTLLIIDLPEGFLAEKFRLLLRFEGVYQEPYRYHENTVAIIVSDDEAHAVIGKITRLIERQNASYKGQGNRRILSLSFPDQCLYLNEATAIIENWLSTNAKLREPISLQPVFPKWYLINDAEADPRYLLADIRMSPDFTKVITAYQALKNAIPRTTLKGLILLASSQDAETMMFHSKLQELSMMLPKRKPTLSLWLEETPTLLLEEFLLSLGVGLGLPLSQNNKGCFINEEALSRCYINTPFAKGLQSLIKRNNGKPSFALCSDEEDEKLAKLLGISYYGRKINIEKMKINRKNEIIFEYTSSKDD